ncbi:MAG: beta-lactamase family protein [Silvibacterium sp.]|nr:beta-lactamase family protein [Silvibacterium sp.]
MIGRLLRALLPLSAFLVAVHGAWPQNAPAPSVAGIWLGALNAGGVSLRIQVQIQGAEPSRTTCSLDSIDQGAFGIPCSNVKVEGSAVSFDVPAVAGKWSGHISTDGKTLSGTWTQGQPMPLVMQRQATALSGPKAPSPDAAMSPVALADLKGVLDRDLAAQLSTGQLAPGTHIGLTIGVLQHGERRILTYGVAKEDSVFEIGSITKTFTATILAQMVEQGMVRLDEPVRELLPPGTVAKPAGPEITLLDLSDQHSGLPRMPDNFHPAHPENPYADYDAKLLYQFIAKIGVAVPPNASFLYSNLGVGLLGQALSNRAKMPYPELLRQQVTGPLGMNDTAVALTPSTQSRFLPGYDGEGHSAHAWDLDALAGAGAIRSTAADMLIYLEAQLHPDKLPPAVLAQPKGKTLPAAIAQTHVIHGEAGPGMHIALNWLRFDATGSYWHNGGTGGYSSYALFNQDKDFALVVLCNCSPGPRSLTDKLGMHISQRLRGEPAVSLAP